MTLNFSTDYMHLLNEWLMTPEPDKVEAVAFLLREAPPDFIFAHSEFVTKLLEIADSVSVECLASVSDHLRTPSVTQGRNGIRGQPFPQDLLLRDRASDMVKKCLPGSPAKRFYSDLAEIAQRSIKQNRMRDEDID